MSHTFPTRRSSVLLLFLVLVAVHLMAESRIPNTSTLEVIDGPQNWSVGQVYGVLAAGILAAVLAAMVYSLAVYNNLLAVLPPIQGSNRSEEHTSDLQSLLRLSYAVFCLKKK